MSGASLAGDTLATVAAQRLRRALATTGIVLDYGEFRIRLWSALPGLAALLADVYPHHRFAPEPCFVDTTIAVRAVAGPRRWLRPLVRLEVDGIDPFGPFPAAQALPHLEWGINWAFANMMNAHLLLHAGTVEIGGKGVLLIGRPGSGKSTLTAGLVARGARLLSDEFGVVRVADAMLLPMARPVALKNRSIAPIRQWWPEARLGVTYLNTRKGMLTHLAVPAGSLARVHEAAQPDLVIFPQWAEGGGHELLPVAEARAFMALASNSFNYETLGAVGFETVARLVDACRCWRLEFADLADAVHTVFSLCEAGSASIVDARIPRAAATANP